MTEGKKIKILVPLTSAELGGGQLFLLTLMEHIAPEFSFTVWLFEAGELVVELRRRGISCRVFPASATRTPWGMWRLRRAMLRESPDIIYLHASRVIALFAKTLGIPVVERMNMSRVREAGGWCNRLPWLDRVMTRWNTKVVAVSGAIREQLVERGIEEEKIAVIHNYVEVQEYDQAGQRESGRAAMGFSDDDVVVLNVGRLVRQKGQADFLTVAASCLPNDKRLRFLLVGDGALYDELHAAADALGLFASGRFQMLPFQSDIVRVYAASDVLLHTAHWEPLGNVLLEAMAAKLLVIATDVDGTREALDDGRSGVLVAKGDVEAMAMAVLGLTHDAERAARLRAHAFARVQKNHSISTVMAQYETLFHNLSRG